jgi:hypothetical protein
MDLTNPHDASQSDATFTCPICLVEKRVVTIANDDDGDDSASDARTRSYAYADEDERLVFILSSCGHKFCAACLRAYVRSKLLDGEIDVTCCHFKFSFPERDGDFHRCDAPMEESDIYQLMRILVVDSDESTDEWHGRDGYDRGIFANCDSSRNDKTNGNDELWTKYQKLKFDLHHGRDTVRRCPGCDEARIFDHESMKRYQAKYLIQNYDPIAAVGDHRSNVRTTGGMSLLERMLVVVRRRMSEVTNVISTDVASDEGVNVSVNMPGPEEGLDVPDNGIKSPDSADPAQPSSAKSKEGDNIQYELNIVASTEKNDDDHDLRSTTTRNVPIDFVSLLERKRRLTHNELDDGRQTSSDEPYHIEATRLNTPVPVKSTIPCVTCRTCSTDFCYFHSNAHPSGTSSCILYHKKSVELDRANLEYVSHTLRARPCPNCGIAVSKEGGCNQIKCGSCGTHFCWICSAVVDDGAFPEHFRWW